MKTLKKVMLAILVAISLGAVSTSVMAEASDGRISYTAADALDLILSKAKIAIEGISQGAEGEAAASLIKDVQDATKEFNSEANGSAVQRANSKLRSARKHAKEQALQEAEQEMRDAQKMFQDMRQYL